VAANLASVTGSRDRTLDPNLQGEYMDEYTAGVDFGLSRDVTIRTNLVRKRDFRGWKELNLAQPFDAFTDRRTAVDPGRDNTVGTSDDGSVEIWSVPRSYPGFGQVRSFFTNAVGGEGDDRYLAFESTLHKRHSAGWSMLASYTIDRREVRNVAPRDPNEARYNWELPETHQGIRLNGTYELPWNFMVSSTFTGQSGAYFPRIVQVRNALNQLRDVTVEGQAGRHAWVKLMDARVSKTFAFGRQSLEGMLDFFNLTNSSVVLRHVNTNGPNYLKPLSTGGIDAAAALPIPAPRIFRLSVRYKF
jgi:hypothetical protein